MRITLRLCLLLVAVLGTFLSVASLLRTQSITLSTQQTVFADTNNTVLNATVIETVGGASHTNSTATGPSPSPHVRFIPKSLHGNRTREKEERKTIDTTINTALEIKLEYLLGEWILEVPELNVSVNYGNVTFYDNSTTYITYNPPPWFTGIDKLSIQVMGMYEEDGEEVEWSDEIDIRVRTGLVLNRAILVVPDNYTFAEVKGGIGIRDTLLEFLDAKNPFRALFQDQDTWLNRRYNTCAIVGNGGSLRGSKRGQEIDSHDIVVRINLSPFLEFAEDVGSKLNISFAYGGASNACWKRNRTGDTKYEVVAQARSKPQWWQLGKCARSSNTVTYSPMSYLFVDLVDNILNEYHRVMFNGTVKKYRSTGMMAVTAMVMICDHVSVYGFERGPNMENHYYESGHEREWIGHSYQAEKAYFRDLANGTGLFEPFLELYDLYTSFSYIID